MDLPLTTINSEIALDICARECGSKCCDFYLNDFIARVNIEDYQLLADHNLQDFVIWDHGDPQLAKQPGGECVFLHPDTKQCSIYTVRPLDCRNFPYFMQEDDIPDHCLLYHRSSPELIAEEREKTHDVPDFDKSYEELNQVEREYIHNLQEQPATSIDHLSYEEIVESDLAYISVAYTTDGALQQAKEQIKKYQNTLTSGYRVLSVMGMEEDAGEFVPIYHILGIIRSSPITTINQINNEAISFPSSLEEVEELLDYVNYYEYHKLIAGLILQDNHYQYLAHLIQ